MNEKKGTEQLIAKYLLGTISETEKKKLNHWIQRSPQHEELFNRLIKDMSFQKRYETYSEISSENAWKHFKKEYCMHRSFKTTTFLKYAAVLALPIIILGGWYYFNSTSLSPKFAKINNFEQGDVIQPGIPNAILVLPQNQTQSLTATIPTQVKVGQAVTAIAQQGTLIYPSASTQTNSEAKDAEVQEDNILATKQGNEFRVTFEDGTTVHLNYNTQLRYPVRFSSSERTVYLKGEAYFKIAKDTRPFYVVTDAGTVKQYGTEFNINTFTPNRTEVVLVKGNISITSPNSKKEQFIKPGQLAYTDLTNNLISILDVDTAPYVAWNDGRLIFENRSLENITEILEHWYKVKISFGSPELKQLHFTGNMDRYGTITPILKAIARTTNLNVQIEGREILITNN